MELIIAEKPSVARDLARVLGIRGKGKGAYESESRIITWCVGHLVQLEEPVAYDGRWKAWRLETLPMLPTEFKLRPAKHAYDQLRCVTTLLRDRRVTSVVNACDAGREGELIFRYLMAYTGRRLPVKRLWISSLTDDSIRRGFTELRPGERFDALGDAARARSEADWLVGMNATRAVTVRLRGAGSDTLFSIGRVQTPTLAMLVTRERAIREFVSRDYFEVHGTFGAERFTAKWKHGRVTQLATAALADAVVARCTTAVEGARIERIRAKTQHEPAPMLFDLTSLQRTANKRFGFTAQRTLDLAQTLYERRKVLTYPRTDSRHLSSDVAKELPKLFAALASVPEYVPFVTQLTTMPPKPGRRVVDDTKVSDHHAIIPTGKKVRRDDLDGDEWRLFDLVARRFLGAFYPDAEFALTEVLIRVGPPGRVPDKTDASASDEPIAELLPPAPDWFVTQGRVRVQAGWQEVAGYKEDSANRLPLLTEGQRLEGNFDTVAKKTQPPPRYTEATLLSAMESAGRTLTDEDLRAAMKDTGLGTPATRAAVIETLLKRTYAQRDKKSIWPTATGILLIERLPVQSLASPELTGSWEARLARIARGEEQRATFMADIATYVRELVATIVAVSPAVPSSPMAATVLGRCPRCRADVHAGARAFACSATCGFSMNTRLAGRILSPALASVLLTKRRSELLRGFRSKAGKKFSAALVLEADGELRFDFDQLRKQRTVRPKRPIAEATMEELPCPRCKLANLVAGKRGWGCARWREGCAFVIWFDTAGRKLSAAQLRDLVVRGKTRKGRFHPNGTAVDGRLVLELDTGVQFVPS